MEDKKITFAVSTHPHTHIKEYLQGLYKLYEYYATCTVDSATMLKMRWRKFVDEELILKKTFKIIKKNISARNKEFL